MNISIGEKKVFGGAAPRYKWLEDYCRCRGVTGGIRFGVLKVEGATHLHQVKVVSELVPGSWRWC